MTNLLFGVFMIIIAPLYAWLWKSPSTLFFAWVVPILPFVIIFDGMVSALRTRTPDEVEALIRTCGAGFEGWEIKSGRDRHLWPCGYINWIICTKRS
jgi:hypothetical protein